jgi:hypothetical protein
MEKTHGRKRSAAMTNAPVSRCQPNAESVRQDAHAIKWWDGGAGSMLDQIICSCGWESATFFDGREYAHAQWKRHVAALPQSSGVARPEK